MALRFQQIREHNILMTCQKTSTSLGNMNDPTLPIICPVRWCTNLFANNFGLSPNINSKRRESMLLSLEQRTKTIPPLTLNTTDLPI